MLTAKDIMTKKVITVKPDTSIEELASLLVKNRISGASWVRSRSMIMESR